MGAQDGDKGSDRSANEQNRLSPSSTQPLLAAAMYARAFEINPAAIGIIRFDDGRIIDVNQTWQEMFGYSREEALGRSAADLRLWPAAEARNHYLEELQRAGSFRNRERTVLRKSGESFQVLCSAELMAIGDGA